MAGERISRYEIGGLISSGGMADIYAARAVVDPGITKRVALKKILRALSADPAFVARFLNEARLAMRLSHANIVQVFDFGRTEEEQYFLAMEFVEGVDLKRLLIERGKGALPLGDALYVTSQVLRALHYAHRLADDHGVPLGVVHRDVKPANILLSFEGEVKLTDFGVARWKTGAELSAAGDICGTIPFMSPEQARGLPVDARSDIFSMGTVLYFMATGVHPFEAENEFATLDRVRAAEYPPPSAHGAPAALDTLVDKALRLNPEERYCSAGEFADIVDEFMFRYGLRGSPVSVGNLVLSTFPEERERLRTLFALTGGANEVAVAQRKAPGDFTQLTNLPVPVDLQKKAVALIWTGEPGGSNGPQGFRRETIAVTPRRSHRWFFVVGFGAVALGIALALGFSGYWRGFTTSRHLSVLKEQKEVRTSAAGEEAMHRRSGGQDSVSLEEKSEEGKNKGLRSDPSESRASHRGPLSTVTSAPVSSPSGPPDKGGVPGPSEPVGHAPGLHQPKTSSESPPRIPGTKAPGGTGILTVNANPWGNVYVNGKFIGATPLLRYPVRAGSVTVTIENPKLGRHTRTLRIRPGKEATVIVDLMAERR